MIAWQDLLEASGSKLELSKCFYYILSWKCDEEGRATPYKISEQRQEAPQIEIKDTNSSMQVKINHKESNESHKSLGCYKSIQGNQDQQVKYLKNRSNKYANAMKNGKLTRKQARMSYKTIFIPSVKYSLPACSLTGADIDHIQKFAIENFVLAIGFEHTIPRALLF